MVLTELPFLCVSSHFWVCICWIKMSLSKIFARGHDLLICAFMASYCFLVVGRYSLLGYHISFTFDIFIFYCFNKFDEMQTTPVITCCFIVFVEFSLFCFVSDKSIGDRVKSVIEHILKLQNYIQNMQSLQVDNQEYAYLKALLLFSPGK